ncbi:MAG: radical SAM protein [Pseudomonadota bacterium]
MRKAAFHRSIQKVLLINPFNTICAYNPEDILSKGVELHPPLGLSYISSYFRENNPDIKIDIFDAHGMAIKICLKEKMVCMPALWQKLKEEIADYGPDIIGISCLFHTTAASAHKTASIAKSIDPTSYTAIGGNYAHTCYNEVLKDPYIDFVVFSEGELTFSNLVNGINQKADLQTIKGIAFRTEMANIVKTDSQNLIPDIDNIPECDRSSFDIDFYSRQGRYFTSRFLDRDSTRITTLVASRGCPHQCTFCSARLLWGGKIRYRNPSIVVDEMLHLRDQFGINTFYFVDDNMFAIGRNIIALADEIRKRIPGIIWVSLGGMQISALKTEVVQSVYESGCKYFILPIESGNPQTLKIIQKPHTVEMAGKAIETIRKFKDTWIAANIITGFPFESKADISNTLDYAKTLDLDWVYFFGYTPLPETQMYKDCLNAGWIQKFTWHSDNPGSLSALNTPNFDSNYIAEQNYAANLDHNFLKNRNIRLRPIQAIRDFQYVLATTKNHALAMWGIGSSYQEIKAYKESEKWFLRALNIIESENGAYKADDNADDSTGRSISKSFFVVKKTKYLQYFQNAGIDLLKCIEKVRQKADHSQTVLN